MCSDQPVVSAEKWYKAEAKATQRIRCAHGVKCLLINYYYYYYEMLVLKIDYAILKIDCPDKLHNLHNLFQKMGV